MRRVIRRKTTSDELDAGSLFAGVGGFDVAAEAVGIPVRAWSEYDPDAKTQNNQAVMRERFPHATALGDVSGVSYADLGRPVLITAGSPCQGFSVAGLRGGMDDHRSGLFTEFVRIVREGIDDGRLKYAVWENVPGALNSNKGQDFANVLAAMVGWDEPLSLPKAGSRRSRWCGVARGPLGFFAWRTIDAQHFGVAQRRQRIFGVWSKTMAGVPALFGPEAIDVVLESEPDVEPEDGVAVWLFDDNDTLPFDALMETSDPVRVKLAHVLDWDVDEKYYLSERACAGILTRATRRGRKLPAVLDYALRLQAGEDVGDPPGKGDAAGTLQNNKVEAVAIPVLGVDPTWVTKAGGVGEDVIPAMRENSWKDPHLVVAPFRKVHRAQTDEDFETWTESEFTNTLNVFDIGDVRATDIVVEMMLPKQVAAALGASGVGTCGADDNQAQAGHLIPIGVSVLGDRSHTLSNAGHDGSEDGTGRGQPIIPVARTFIIEPESGQGADLRAREADSAPALTANWLERVTDRGLRVVAPITYRVRRITPLEAERLQGFPDGHTDIDGAADSHRYRQMGNAVAVPCAAWVLARLKAVHEGRELPGLPEVLEKLPWLRRESSVETVLVLLRSDDETSVPSSNGKSRSLTATSSRRVVRRSDRSWV